MVGQTANVRSGLVPCGSQSTRAVGARRPPRLRREFVSASPLRALRLAGGGLFSGNTTLGHDPSVEFRRLAA